MTLTKPLRVLIPIHPELDALDYIGPLALLVSPRIPQTNDPSTSPSISSRAFEILTTSLTPMTAAEQGVVFGRDISMEEAYRILSIIDILIVPGGASAAVLDANTEPLSLIKAFSSLPACDPGSERIIMSVCTGALFLASQGVLKGQVCTTNSFDLDRLRTMVASAGSTVVGDKGERFVVNPIGGVKGEGLDGYRVITSGGPGAGMDLSLWLIEHFLGIETRIHVENLNAYSSRLEEGLIL